MCIKGWVSGLLIQARIIVGLLFNTQARVTFGLLFNTHVRVILGLFFNTHVRVIFGLFFNTHARILNFCSTRKRVCGFGLLHKAYKTLCNLV